MWGKPALAPPTATQERLGVLAGEVANLSGADLSTDRALLAVDTHTTLYVYQAADPSLPGAELVADLISRPRPGRSSSPARARA
jgi:hypothetical protein